MSNLLHGKNTKAGPTLVSKNRNVDAVFYHNLFAKGGDVFDAVDEKMPWLRGAEYIIQQDGAKPHTANGTVEELELAGNDGRGMIPRFKTQSSQSPDVNVNDLGFFAGLKAEVRDISSHVTDREQMMDMDKTASLRYLVEKIGGIWGCLFNSFRSVMKCRGGNQYKEAHNGGKLTALTTGTSVDLSVDVDDYQACLAIIN